MKIRNGFVSNSSSSSFLIYGIFLENDEILKALKLGEYAENAETNGEDSDDVDVYEIVDKKLQDTDLEYHSPEYTDGFYIGKSWASVGDEETGKQFKDDIESELTKIFGEGLDFGTHEECWRDG